MLTIEPFYLCECILYFRLAKALYKSTFSENRLRMPVGELLRQQNDNGNRAVEQR